MLSVIGIFANIIAAVVTITLHEWIKALISSYYGDPLPKRDKRTLPNPLKHIEPIGFIVMAMIGFGWGKPLETAPVYYKDRKKATLVTYTLPSAANFVFGLLLILIASLFRTNNSVYTVMFAISLFNMRHALFNVIPVYPLDGAKVLAVFRNPNQVINMVNNQMFYQLILILLTVYGATSKIIDPVCYFAISLIERIF